MALFTKAISAFADRTASGTLNVSTSSNETISAGPKDACTPIPDELHQSDVLSPFTLFSRLLGANQELPPSLALNLLLQSATVCTPFWSLGLGTGSLAGCPCSSKIHHISVICWSFATRGVVPVSLPYFSRRLERTFAR